MTKKILGLALGALMSLVIALPAVHAQTTTTTTTTGALGEDDFYGGTLTGTTFADTAGLSAGDLPTTVASMIRVALGFLGIIAVCIILIGGFKWMTAGGHDDKVKSARKVMVSGVIGLIIVLCAFAIAQFVIGSILTATA